MKTGLKIKLIRKERQFGVWVWLLALWAVSWLIDSKERKKEVLGVGMDSDPDFGFPLSSQN